MVTKNVSAMSFKVAANTGIDAIKKTIKNESIS